MGRLIILGDFNLRVKNPGCNDARQFKDLIVAACLVQHVRVSTHDKGHTLDLVITRASDSCASDFIFFNVLP